MWWRRRKAAALEQALQRGVVLADAQNFARDLGNEPANRLPPLVLAERAAAMAHEYRLDCEVLDQDRMRQLGMGSLLGVAMGSEAAPAFIVIRYTAGSRPHRAIISL